MSIDVTELAFIAYPITNVERSKDFYGRVIGLPCTMDHPLPEEGQRWIEFDAGNSTIAISNYMPPATGCGVGAALEVKDLDAALLKLRAENVEIKSEVIEAPGCRFFLIADPDGNDLTIHQHKHP